MGLALVRKLVDGAWRYVAEQDADGGSDPQVVSQTITAATVAAAWNGDYLQAAVALPGIAVGDLVQNIWEAANTLDQGITFRDFTAYLPGQSTANVSDNGNLLDGVIGALGSDGTYAYEVTHATVTNGVIKAGAQAYALFSGDAAPTTGSVTITWLAAAA